MIMERQGIHNGTFLGFKTPGKTELTDLTS